MTQIENGDSPGNRLVFDSSDYFPVLKRSRLNEASLPVQISSIDIIDGTKQLHLRSNNPKLDSENDYSSNISKTSNGYSLFEASIKKKRKYIRRRSICTRIPLHMQSDHRKDLPMMWINALNLVNLDRLRNFLSAFAEEYCEQHHETVDDLCEHYDIPNELYCIGVEEIAYKNYMKAATAPDFTCSLKRVKFMPSYNDTNLVIDATVFYQGNRYYKNQLCGDNFTTVPLSEPFHVTVLSTLFIHVNKNYRVFRIERWDRRVEINKGQQPKTYIRNSMTK